MTSIGKCSEGVLQLSQGLLKSPAKAEVWRREKDEEGESHLSLCFRGKKWNWKTIELRFTNLRD